MKIKHWQGYGTVNAKKLCKVVENSRTTLVVEVSGDHEWGLERDDIYDLKQWLIDKFDKSAKDVNPYNMRYSIIDDYQNIAGEGYIEYCIYTFDYEV